MRKNNKKGFKYDYTKILDDKSPFIIKEVYNLVRAKLMFTAKGEKCPIYVVTSATISEGKTTNAINLAISFAMAGKRTLIIDSDLRKPAVHKYLTTKNECGLSELLAKLEDTIKLKKTKYDNLFLLTAGNIPPNPSELIVGKGFHILLKSLAEKFDCIFIDTPPVGLVSDAALLTEYVTGYILVVRNGVSDKMEVHNAVQIIENMNGNIVGFLLNNVDKKMNEYPQKYYSSGYYGKEKSIGK